MTNLGMSQDKETMPFWLACSNRFHFEREIHEGDETGCGEAIYQFYF